MHLPRYPILEWGSCWFFPVVLCSGSKGACALKRCMSLDRRLTTSTCALLGASHAGACPGGGAEGPAGGAERAAVRNGLSRGDGANRECVAYMRACSVKGMDTAPHGSASVLAGRGGHVTNSDHMAMHHMLVSCLLDGGCWSLPKALLGSKLTSILHASSCPPDSTCLERFAEGTSHACRAAREKSSALLTQMAEELAQACTAAASAQPP